MHFSIIILCCLFLILMLISTTVVTTPYFQNIISAAYAASPTSVKDITGTSTSIGIIDNQNKTKTHYFIFPSQKAFFGPIINATKQGDAAILNGKWTIQQSRAIANGLSSIAKQGNSPSPQMKSITDHYVQTSDGKDKILLRFYDPGVKQKPSPILIFAHGGGWTVGSVDIFDDSIKRLANSSG